MAGQASQTPTTQPPVFRTEVEYVEVDAVVTDLEGNFVRDLGKDDFQVFEDGRAQTISTFSLVDIPVERLERPLFAVRPVEPDVQSNQRPFDGRVYVVILDDLHTEALRSQRVKVAARQFIERNLGANDRMAVIFTGGRADAAQAFTSNKRLLLNAVDRFLGRKLPSTTLAKNEEYWRRRNMPFGDRRVTDPYDMERAYNTRSMLETLQKVAEWFSGVRGRRRTVLLVSEGIDYDITEIIRQYDSTPSMASSIIDDIRQTIAATARSNVSIYAIDPRGLGGLADDDITVGSFADADRGDTDPDTGAVTPGQAPNYGLRSLNNELWMSQLSLRTLSEETGGFAAVNRNDFTTAFERIVKDNSSYYVLAYYPAANKRDGKFHKIEVRVRRPGLTVRARRGYVAPKGRPSPPRNTKTGGMSPELFEAINSPLNVSGVRMQAFAAPFKGPAPNASVLVGVELAGRDLSLATSSKVEVSYLAVDAKSKVYGPRNDVITMNFRPETRPLVEQSGIRSFGRLDLPPGRYQLRVAARDVASASVGSVIYDLEVPEFYKERISLSGIALTSLAGAAMPSGRLDDQFKEVLPAPPVGQRTFPQNDEIALFAEVYDNSGAAPHKVDIVASVLTDEGRVLYKHEEERSSSELYSATEVFDKGKKVEVKDVSKGVSGGFGYTARIPLSEIPPGLYVLNVEARSRLGDNPSAVRQVRFRVVPPVR
jgi:VWFA-related protein